ncbi:hypothetical protein PPN31114_04399 [Pandoraea pneumonica]|jgi:hypothetical protein|uniref:DUF4180 domain-containing protein n=1 Tax=Pandoraea pneumonica TaxID=2508299 RepID=A0A5E4YAF8_9BURK|nr:DUF4180 domain-containing protein [Pandoraea pneumonica]VVE45676.1 hypothetical protein PPN31114_04399 [Pandoraea pneumonica]
MPQALNPRDEIIAIDNVPLLVWNAPANAIAREADVNELLAAAWENDVTWVAVHTDVLHDDFYRLETGLAGAMLQKLVNYGVKLAVIGDITPWLARSEAFSAFVREANRGRTTAFTTTLEALKRHATKNL